MAHHKPGIIGNSSRLQGEVPLTSELHGEFVMLQTYDECEVKERGSVAQFIELLDVKEHNPKKVSSNWKDTWLTLHDVYTLSASMKFFGMSDLVSCCDV